MYPFNADPKVFLNFFFELFFVLEGIEKPPQKVAILMAVGSFFSAAPTAHNSPELHFCFIDSFIQPSLVGSLVTSLE